MLSVLCTLSQQASELISQAGRARIRRNAVLHFKLVVHAWFTQLLLGCNTAATAILEKCIAYAQAVGRTSPTMDTKVCNKKVAVDDSVVARRQLTQGGKITETTLIPRKVQDGYWSCVDYEDDMDKTVYEYRGGMSGQVNERRPKKELAEHPSGSTLSGRFKRENMPNEPREDVYGSCRTSDMRLEAVTCTGDEPRETNERGDSTGIKDRWWTGKRTNAGWPGTAEGKINTAQGMAGDLVSNLDSEEKSAVAGILTRTISGGEVVEVTAVTTASVMANVCSGIRDCYIAAVRSLIVGLCVCPALELRN